MYSFQMTPSRPSVSLDSICQDGILNMGTEAIKEPDICIFTKVGIILVYLANIAIFTCPIKNVASGNFGLTRF